MKFIFVVVCMGLLWGVGSSGFSEDFVVDIGDVGDNGYLVVRIF